MSSAEIATTPAVKQRPLWWLGSWVGVAALALGAASLTPTFAHAGAPEQPGEDAPDSKARVAIAAIVFEGDVSEAGRASIRAAVEDGLRTAGAAVVTADEVAAAAPGAGECTTSACLAELAERLDVSHVVRVEVVASGRDYDLRLALVDRGGKQSNRSNQCQICGFAEVATMVGDEAGAFAAALERVDLPARFHVESTPTGAEVRIDGELVGTTPLDVEVSPGAHEVAVSRPGFSAARSELVAVPGVEERLTLGLVELPEQHDPQRQRRLRIAGWSLVGVGVAAAGGGAAALALHHKAPSSRCTPDVIDVNGLCQWRYNTLPVGIPLVAVGGAAIIAGAVLAAVGGKQRRASELAVSVGPDGVLISGRF